MTHRPQRVNPHRSPGWSILAFLVFLFAVILIASALLALIG